MIPSAVVYIVTDGEYSDYHIVAAFGDKREAEKCIALLGGGNIEEYELGKRATEVVWWHAMVDDNGDVTALALPQTGDMWESVTWAPRIIRYVSEPTEQIGHWQHRGVGRTPDGAVKSARDQMTRSKAERAGITP